VSNDFGILHILFRSGRLFSGEIERWAADATRKIESHREEMEREEGREE